MKYSYDEEGVLFYYFIISLASLWVLPTTYRLLFSRARTLLTQCNLCLTQGSSEAKKNGDECSCEKCKAKNAALRIAEKKARKYKVPKYLLLLAGWAVMALGMRAVWNAKVNFKPYDPFEILGVSSGAKDEEIKRAFKVLSLKYHPDKAENKEEAERKFVEISKAYKALTDEVTKRNWEEYGNPDGMRQFSLGIALPSWLVDRKNTGWVLGFYGLAFGIILPFLVGSWWSKSKKYTKDKILHTSMALYYHEMKDNMSVKKIMEALAGSSEFKDEVPWRLSDEKALETFLQFLSTDSEMAAGEKYEKPKKFNTPPCVKAHALLFAHLYRIPVGNADLASDQQLIVQRSCQLVLGMLQIATARHWLQTALNCMNLSQLIVQAEWENQSPLLQLPCMDSQIVKHCKTRKRSIRSIRELLEMEDGERRSLLRTLTDEEYANLLRVAKTFPEITIKSASFQILGQDDITPEGLITCKVRVRMDTLGRLMDSKGIVDSSTEMDETESQKEVVNFEFDEDGALLDETPSRPAVRDGPLNPGKPIHCPYFPLEKQPFWWVILTNRNNTSFICMPIKVSALAEGVTLQFAAPSKPGSVAVMVQVKSDAVIGADQTKACTFTVVSPSRAAGVSAAANEDWDISGEEDESDQRVPLPNGHASDDDYDTENE